MQEVERRKAESPEGQIAAAREADQAREEQAELVGLAQRQLGLSDEDVADLGPHRVLRKAGFVEVTADDLPKLDADEADEWLLAHPDEMNRLMEKAAGEHLLSKWNGLPAVDRAREAALVDTTVEAVEAELSRRGIEFSSIADHVAARQVFEEVKGGDES
ncbi:MAG: hypothetical protein ACRDG7_19585 [Candidatus Limnocylindria bacterium]